MNKLGIIYEALAKEYNSLTIEVRGQHLTMNFPMDWEEKEETIRMLVKLCNSREFLKVEKILIHKRLKD
jgi:hypothetical protein